MLKTDHKIYLNSYMPTKEVQVAKCYLVGKEAFICDNTPKESK
jgi:hypothetical protein